MSNEDVIRKTARLVWPKVAFDLAANDEWEVIEIYCGQTGQRILMRGMRKQIINSQFDVPKARIDINTESLKQLKDSLNRQATNNMCMVTRRNT